MKQTGRIFMYPVNDHPRKPHKHYQHKNLKALSTDKIWTLLEDTRATLQNGLFLTRQQILDLEITEARLESDLDDRIFADEALCRKYGPLYRDGRLWTEEELKRYSLLQRRQLAKPKKIKRALLLKALKRQHRECEALRVSSLNPSRKAICRVPNTQFNGLKKPKHIPNPNNRIRVDRSKIKREE